MTMRKRRDNNRLHERVKTARKRSASSARWLERQLNDPYVAAAKRDGYYSRAAYKLLEIDARFHLFKRGACVVDLGAAPGGWSQVAAQQIRGGKVIAVDLLEMAPIPFVKNLQLDFLADDAPATILKNANGRADVVLSDMAAAVTGHKQTDHLRTIALAEASAYFACEALGKGGAFCAKVFQGGSSNDLLQMLKNHFSAVHHIKPKASRKESVELYVVALGFKGRGEPPAKLA